MSRDPTRKAESIEDDVAVDLGNIAHDSSVWKVLGETDTADATGVLGHNTATTGTGIGVKGVTDSSAASGVEGRATAASGATFGVAGYTDSQTDGAAGVFGKVTASTNQELSNGIAGLDPTEQGTGVYGNASATTGANWGVYGASSSPDGFGVYSAGKLGVSDSVSIEKLGLDAEMNDSLSVSGSYTTVVYDTVNIDDRNEYDESTGEFTCANDGTYQIEAQIEWPSTVPDHTGLYFRVMVNGSQEIVNFVGSGATGFGPTHSISKTMRDLNAGDVVTLEADHDDGSNTHDLGGFSEYAQLQITQIG